MKVLSKIALAMFSVIMLIISVIYTLVYFGIMDYSLFDAGVRFMLAEEPNRTVFLAVAIISIVLSIAVLFDSDGNSNNKGSIEIKGADGILEIMPATIEHIALISLSSYPSVSDVNAKMMSKSEGLVIDISFSVLPDTNITELVEKLQSAIKAKVEQQTSAKVLEVNIVVKGVSKSKSKEE